MEPFPNAQSSSGGATPPPDLATLVRQVVTLSPGPLRFDFQAVCKRGTVEWFIEPSPLTVIVKATALSVRAARTLAHAGAVHVVDSLRRKYLAREPTLLEIPVRKHHTEQRDGATPLSTDYYVVLVELHGFAVQPSAAQPPPG